MEEQEESITLRDKFAIEILQAFLSTGIIDGAYSYSRTYEDKDEGHINWSDKQMTGLIRTSYRIADMMRKVRLGVFK